MKLYSHRQVIFFSVLSAVVASIVAAGLIGAISLGLFTPVSVRVNNTETMQEVHFQAQREPGSEFVLIQSEPMAHNVYEFAHFSESERENILIYERLNAAVVNITTETMAINWFLEPVPQTGSSGSGSIIDVRGYVLTNNHVIRNAHRVFINLADGSQFEGRVIG
ncbi:MAG: S1C family serine protease, partial [Treponema sp.]|nr:S1C family serine protease [Treponema sp.]